MNINDLYALYDSRTGEQAKRDKNASSGTTVVKAHGDISGSTEITALDSAKLGVTVYNNTNGIVYIKLGGGTVSSTSFSVLLRSNDYYEAPYRFEGSITAIKDSSTSSGNIYITEFK